MKVLVVGGGTAGLISALILKKHLDITVDIVHSKNIGIIGVGEGSTEHFTEFTRFLGIDHYDLIKECDATYKAGIMYEGWTNKPYIHSVATPFNSKVAQYSYVYANQISEGSNYLNPKIVWDNKIETWLLNKKDVLPFNQYHFNTFKLNAFLIKIAKSMGIKVFEDDIIEVSIDKSNNISNLVGKSNDYHYDFYIDSTGFKKLLITAVGGKWESFSQHLTMNSAIVFPTEDEDNYNLWTLSKAMSSGWMFRLPVWSRYGNGYIFNDNFISAEDAKKEIESLLKKDINFGKEFKFDPGKINKAWINNCVAVGLSGSFVEPLEASSIGTSIQQSFLLMHRLINYTQDSIDSYNKSFNDIMFNIRDFLFLHYMVDKKDTPFWQYVSTIKPPESLQQKLNIWKNKLPISEDFNALSDYVLFKEANYIIVGQGVGIFDNESIKKEYLTFPLNVKNEALRIIELEKFNDLNNKTINHKDFIKIIRESL